MYRENPEETDDRQYYDYHLDRNGSPLESELKKQTAVEFLIEMTSKLGYISADIVEQAKEMEKQQIINAFNEGEINSVDYFNAENITIEEAEQYYNETFGKL